MNDGNIEKTHKRPSVVFFLVYTLLAIVALLPYAPIFINDNNIITWNEADKHINDGIYSVKGKIAGSNYAKDETGSPVFIDIGKPYPEYGRTTLVIWEEDQKHFKMKPSQIAKYYKKRIGDEIIAAGYIDTYDNATEIKIRYPQQIGVGGKKAQKHFMRSPVLVFIMFFVYIVFLGLLWGTMQKMDDDWKNEGVLYKVATIYYLCLGAIVVGKLVYFLFLS